jgi:hypothetical protein
MTPDWHQYLTPDELAQEQVDTANQREIIANRRKRHNRAKQRKRARRANNGQLHD